MARSHGKIFPTASQYLSVFFFSSMAVASSRLGNILLSLKCTWVPSTSLLPPKSLYLLSKGYLKPSL